MGKPSIGRWFDRVAWAGAAAFAVVAVSVSGNAFAQATGIVTTKHNLGSTSAAGNNQVTDTAEVCVFCHTPHGGSTSAPAPLWNKRLRSDGLPANGVGTYTSYATLQTPSLDGIVAPVGSISVACLSCHDGTQAMDNIINAPGSGNVTADGGGDLGLGYTWSGPRVDAQGRLTGGPALLGIDLSNDHPIGIQYCGGGLSGSGTTVSGTCRDSDFVLPQTQNINNNQVFWIETGGTGKQRTDLPLYERNFVGTGGGIGPSVECGSCHDPHVSTGQAGPAGTGRTAGETFLRMSNAGSAVCTACHVK
jgi:hypothetical protein